MQITKIRFGVWQSINSVTGKTRTPVAAYRANKAVLALANPFISLLFCP
jgi:hypothetical protein